MTVRLVKVVVAVPVAGESRSATARAVARALAPAEVRSLFVDGADYTATARAVGSGG